MRCRLYLRVTGLFYFVDDSTARLFCQGRFCVGSGKAESVINVRNRAQRSEAFGKTAALPFLL